MADLIDSDALVVIEERVAFDEKEYSGVAAEYLDALRTAADALRERMEREKGCRFCAPEENEKKYICGSRYIHAVYADRDVPFWEEIPAIFCPMCGCFLPPPGYEEREE